MTEILLKMVQNTIHSINKNLPAWSILLADFDFSSPAYKQREYCFGNVRPSGVCPLQFPTGLYWSRTPTSTDGFQCRLA